MADNTTLNLGTGGDVISTDDISGVKVQRVKNQFGADGVAIDVADADGARLPVQLAKAGTATRTSVSDSAASVTLLAANAARKGAVVTNDSSGTLYLALGAAAATLTDYTKKLEQDQSWEVPVCYTGIIVGIWGTDPNDGGARVAELT